MRQILSLVIVAALFICCKNNNADKPKDYSMNEYADIDSIQKEKAEGRKLNLKTLAISNNNDTLLLQDIISNDLLYIRYSNKACQECLDFIVNKMSNHVRNGQCVFLVSEMPQRDMHVYERTQEGTKIYLIDSLNVDFDEALTPYVFRMQDGKVKDFIIPRKEQEMLFNEFLERNKLKTNRP